MKALYQIHIKFAWFLFIRKDEMVHDSKYTSLQVAGDERFCHGLETATELKKKIKSFFHFA